MMAIAFDSMPRNKKLLDTITTSDKFKLAFNTSTKNMGDVL